jgi:predicted DNA-binding protein YlxM (UPF0122 family)
MDKNIRLGWLLDFYGEFLTEKQRSLMEQHYNEDLSLGEIAARTGITRQGVHDSLRRGAEILERCEERLRLLQRYLAVKAGLGGLTDMIAQYNSLDEAATTELKRKLQELSAIWEGNDGL